MSFEKKLRNMANKAVEEYEKTLKTKGHSGLSESDKTIFMSGYLYGFNRGLEFVPKKELLKVEEMLK